MGGDRYERKESFEKWTWSTKGRTMPSERLRRVVEGKGLYLVEGHCSLPQAEAARRMKGSVWGSRGSSRTMEAIDLY